MEKVKLFLKDFLSKMPIFLFCVAFISVHNILFGTENSIICVIVLTGLFMFMRGDLGFRVEQASVSIFSFFVIMGIAAKVSVINPFLGIFVNFIVINLLLIISSHDLTQGNHVPFMMGYIFAQGYDVSGAIFGKRMISLCVGGLVIALLYYFINRKKEYKRNFKDLFREWNIYSIRTQWYIRMSVTLTIAMFIGDICNYPRTMWVTLTILSLTMPFGEEHKERGRVRIVAAILGTALFYILFQILIPVQYQSIVVMLAGFIAMFIQNYFIKSIYNSFSALGAAVLLFPTKDALLLRVGSNIIGTAVAVCSYGIFNIIFNKLRLSLFNKSEISHG